MTRKESFEFKCSTFRLKGCVKRENKIPYLLSVHGLYKRVVNTFLEYFEFVRLLMTSLVKLRANGSALAGKFGEK